MRTNRKQAFTLVELMVVISVIAILMAASFRLMRAAAHAKKIAETKAKIQRLENALSGYYAHFGHYPPVAVYSSLNPLAATDYDSIGGSFAANQWKDQARWAARAQPTSFEYPTPRSLTTPMLRQMFPNDNIMSINDLVPMIPKNLPNWSEGVKAFKFGLLSFLVPRLEMTYYNDRLFSGGSTLPLDLELFDNAQWRENNTGTPSGSLNDNKLEAMRQKENEICAKWLPHMEHTLNGKSEEATLLGVKLWTGASGPGGIKPRMTGAPLNQMVAVLVSTCTDAWDNEFFYHSLPPYQSYILWSAGPNGETIPPWIKSTDNFYQMHKDEIPDMIDDDIVGGRM